MKMTIVFIFLTTLFLTDPGWSQESPVQWKTIPSKKYHFSIQTPYPLYLPKKPVSSVLFLDNRTAAQMPAFHLFIGASHSAKLMFGRDLQNLKEMSEQALQDMKTEKALSEQQTKDKTVRIASGQDGILTLGTGVDYNGASKKLLMLNVKRNEECWEVMILYDSENPAQEKMAERVVNSFRILK